MAVNRLGYGLGLALLAGGVPNAAVAQTTETTVAPQIAPVDPDDKVRCRRIAITGSLVKSVKACKTVGEWRRLSDRGNDVVRDQADASRMCSGGDIICRGN